MESAGSWAHRGGCAVRAPEPESQPHQASPEQGRQQGGDLPRERKNTSLTDFGSF